MPLALFPLQSISRRFPGYAGSLATEPSLEIAPTEGGIMQVACIAAMRAPPSAECTEPVRRIYMRRDPTPKFRSAAWLHQGEWDSE